jgi:transposase-like protein
VDGLRGFPETIEAAYPEAQIQTCIVHLMAASKLLYLARRFIEKNWKMPPITWKQAVNQFAILFGERFTNALG